MITRDELLAQARAFDLNDADVQRDYMFGWLISGIYNTSELGPEMVLKGGNALRKALLPQTRFSDDLDFSVPFQVDPEHVLAQLNQVCAYASTGTGIRFNLDRNRLASQQQIDGSRHVFKYKLYFADAIGGRDHVQIALRIDVSEWDRLQLPVLERELIHPYSDSDAVAATVRCVALEEALADKMKCLLQRRYCYDLFDLAYGAFGTHGIELDRALMLDVFFNKTVFGRSPAAARSLLLDLPLNAFRGFWDKVLTPTFSRLSFDRAVDIVTSGVAELFGDPYDPYGDQYAFYPSQLRNLILEAGADRRLLRLTYNGWERIVEPYALKFKTRTDGVGQEYLYVHDRVGGHSGPGMKSLVHYKIDDLEVLDEHFEPIYEVSLGKSGDAGQEGVFVGNRGARAGRSGRRSSRPRAAYRVKCSACGKTFGRTGPSTRLNPHKAPGGWPCSNRSGYRT